MKSAKWKIPIWRAMMVVIEVLALQIPPSPLDKGGNRAWAALGGNGHYQGAKEIYLESGGTLQSAINMCTGNGYTIYLRPGGFTWNLESVPSGLEVEICFWPGAKVTGTDSLLIISSGCDVSLTGAVNITSTGTTANNFGIVAHASSILRLSGGKADFGLCTLADSVYISDGFSLNKTNGRVATFTGYVESYGGNHGRFVVSCPFDLQDNTFYSALSANYALTINSAAKGKLENNNIRNKFYAGNGLNYTSTDTLWMSFNTGAKFVATATAPGTGRIVIGGNNNFADAQYGDWLHNGAEVDSMVVLGGIGDYPAFGEIIITKQTDNDHCAEGIQQVAIHGRQDNVNSLIITGDGRIILRSDTSGTVTCDSNYIQNGTFGSKVTFDFIDTCAFNSTDLRRAKYVLGAKVGDFPLWTWYLDYPTGANAACAVGDARPNCYVKADSVIISRAASGTSGGIGVIQIRRIAP